MNWERFRGTGMYLRPSAWPTCVLIPSAWLIRVLIQVAS